MSVELRPFGVTCNIGCVYCYQNKDRDTGMEKNSYDIPAMKNAVEEIGGPFALFGGEPLLMPDNDLEKLWRWGLKQYGSNSIQTNGVLVSDNHIRMFKKYKVQVSISVDGPDALNDPRWAGTLEKTRRDTAKTERAIERLCEEGIAPGLMIQIHRSNGSAERLSKMCDWFRKMDALGVPYARLHILEIQDESVRKKFALSKQENIKAFQTFSELENEFGNLSFDIFGEIENLLQLDDDDACCVWRACDPYTTEAVNGVDGDGTRHNCGLTDTEGINFQKPAIEGYERYVSLYQTPQEYGGCKDCRFFLACKGQCPGTAIGGDWRNRSENCEVWKALFTLGEKRLEEKEILPFTKAPYREELEKQMIGYWEKGINPSMNLPLSTKEQVGQGSIKWERLAEPQPDLYDSLTILEFAQKTTSEHRRNYYVRREPKEGEPTIFDGKVAVRYIQPTSPYEAPLVNGPIDHPNIYYAAELVRRWPLVHQQFQVLIDSFHPLWDQTISLNPPEFTLSSASGTDEARFGTLHATVMSPLALAEAFVHEMAHQKLHALGVSVESASRLITNSPDKLYRSPVIRDRLRPMTAVFHAEYSFIHILQMNVHMIENESDLEQKQLILELMSDTLPFMEEGREEIIQHIETDSEGADFVGAFLEWADRTILHANYMLEENAVEKVAIYSH